MPLYPSLASCSISRGSMMLKEVKSRVRLTDGEPEMLEYTTVKLLSLRGARVSTRALDYYPFGTEPQVHNDWRTSWPG